MASQPHNGHGGVVQSPTATATSIQQRNRLQHTSVASPPQMDSEDVQGSSSLSTAVASVTASTPPGSIPIHPPQPTDSATTNAHSSNNSGSSSSNPTASHLIRTLDSAFASLSGDALTSAKTAESARKNARIASELIRLNNNQHAAGTAPNNHHLTTPADSKYAYPSTPGAYPTLNGVHNNSNNDRSTTPFTPATMATPPPSSYQVKGNQTPFSPAQDVLALSLELERTKQALADERASHAETRTALEHTKQSNGELSTQLQDVQRQHELERQQQETHVQQLESDLEVAQGRMEAAEEDAQQALDLAKSNVDSREQVEEWLRQAMEEIQMLRAHVAKQQQTLLSSPPPPAPATPPQQALAEGRNGSGVGTSKNGSRSLETISEEDNGMTSDEGISNSSNHSSSSASNRPSRALVAAGRELLQKSTQQHQTPMVVVPSVSDAAERRRRLKERFESTSPRGGTTTSSLALTMTPDSSASSSSSPSSGRHPTPPPPPPPPKGHYALGSSVETLEIARRATKVLKESGKRLKLSGRWWTGMSAHSGPDELHLDVLARHYCLEVENMVDQKNKGIAELESLCDLYEKSSSKART